MRTTNINILMYESDKDLVQAYGNFLSEENYDVISTSDLEIFKNHLQHHQKFQLIIVDISCPLDAGLKFFQLIKDHVENIPIIIITSSGSIQSAIDLMRLGASNYLVKPFAFKKLKIAVNLSIAGQKKGQEQKDNFLLEGKVQNEAQQFIGLSKPMQNLYKIIKSVSANNLPVFIMGETGTGKEICAENIHYYSDRSAGEFIPINCATLSSELSASSLFGHKKGAFTGAVEGRRGAIEQAQGGTLFLDEICEMPLKMQARLLRFLENYRYQRIGCDEIRQADIRIICATNKNIAEELEAGKFRHDLYYRLHVISINMPALRTREGDIELLADHFLEKYNDTLNKNFVGFSDDVLMFFNSYPWTGNVRELENMIKNVVALNEGNDITLDMLTLLRSAKIQREYGAHQSLSLEEVERQAIENTIRQCGGNIAEAAHVLKVSQSTLYRKKSLWDSHEKDKIR